MIEAALYARLTTPTMGAKVRDQVTSTQTDYETGMVVYQQIAAGVEDTRSVGGPVTIFRTLQQIDIYATKKSRALALANEVRTRLDGQINQTWGGLTIKASIFDDQRAGNFQDTPEISGVYRIIQQYRIVYAA